MQNLSGQKLGNYELRERLGRGGMAEVYKAYQPAMDRFVAVKVMLGHLATDDSFIERFKREAQAVGKLRHSHIIHIFDFGIQDDIYYMAMEFVTDGDLKEYIIDNEKLPLADSLKITRDLADALDYAHKQGMIHRDLKPANVMFVDKAKLNVVLTDFGIARILDATGLTGTGMAVGTPSYMSPEAGSGEDTDERADIYALGIILYEMLVGKVPYNADTPLAVIMKHISAPLPTRSEYGDNIPEPVEAIMLKCLAKDPDDRYKTGGELRDALSEVLKQASNLEKTDSVPAKQADTKVAASNKTRSPVVSDPDAPTTMIGMDDTIPDLPEPAGEASSQNNPMMMYGAIAVIAILIIAGLFYFNSTNNSTDDDGAPVAEVVETDEATEEIVPTDVPDETEEPEPTAVPDETEEPEPTAIPDDEEPTSLPDDGIAPPPDEEFEFDLTLGGEMPPNPENLSLFSNINEVLNEAEKWVIVGDMQAAIFYIDSILENDPENPDALYAKAQLHAQQWDPENIGGETAQRLIELQPESPWGYIALSDSFLNYPIADEEDSFDQSLAALEQAFEIAPDNPHVLYRMGMLGDWELSFERMINAEATGASGYRFMWVMADFLYETGQHDRAIPYYEALHFHVRGEYMDTDHIFWSLVGSLIQTDRAADGVELIRTEGILDDTTNWEAFIDAAFTALRAGDFDQAEEWANTALAFSSDAHGATYILALVASQRDGDAEQALELLNSLEDEEVYSRFLNIQFAVDLNLDRGRVLVDAGRAEEALEFYDVAIEFYSYTPQVYEERAGVYIILDDREAARTDLQTAFDISDDPEYRNHIRDLIIELGPASGD